jgi:hypothetical protein
MRRLLLAAFAATAMLVPAGAQERLPDGIVNTDNYDIAEAWLTRPTDLCAHGILGDAIEAGGLAVTTRDGKTLELVLPEKFVFEDRQARIHDLDGDGRDEIIVVLTSVTEGGALAIYGVRDGKLVKLAQTPHIGRTNRWINPAEFADLDGDGLIEITAVWKPHLARELQAWRYANGKLTHVTTIEGYSNHEIGSRVQDMSEVVKLSDGRTAMAIATPGYDEIAFLVLKDGNLSEVTRVPAGGKITSPVTLNDNGRRLVLATGQKKRSVVIP